MVKPAQRIAGARINPASGRVVRLGFQTDQSETLIIGADLDPCQKRGRHSASPRPPVDRDFRKVRHPVPIFGHHRSEEHTSELQSLMRISYAVFCLKKKKIDKKNTIMINYPHTRPTN